MPEPLASELPFRTAERLGLRWGSCVLGRATALKASLLALAVVLFLALSPVLGFALGGTYTVTNTNDSAAGSLRDAIDTINPGGGTPPYTIDFAIPAGSTITIPSVLATIAQDVSITNASGGTITLSTTLSDPVFATDASITLGGTSVLNISANVPGSWAYGIASDTSNLNIGSIGSLVSVTAQAGVNSAFALYSDDDVTVTGDMAGTLTATAGGKVAVGMLSTGGALTIGGALSGSISATTSSADNAYGLSSFDPMSIGSVSSAASVTALAATHDAYGLHSSTDLTITGGMAGAISATAGTNYAYGMTAASGDLSIGGDLSGSVVAKAVSGSYAYAINAEDSTGCCGNLNINAISSTGRVTAQAGASNAYGLNSTANLTIPGGMAGAISAMAGTHTAVGIQSGGTLNGGSSSLPLSISGTVSATANGLAVAAGSAGAMNLNVTGTLSGVDTSGGGAGYAIRAGAPDGVGGWTAGSANNAVTLGTGAHLVGIVDLGSGNNTLTTAGTGSASNLFIGVTNLVAGNANGTPTSWVLNPNAANASTFGNLTVNANAALSINEYVTIQGDTVNNGALTFDIGTTKTYSGVISGLGSVTKAGSGILYLRGANTYTGGTYLNGGILNVLSDANLGDPSGMLVFNGGTLQTAAAITSARSITVNSGGGTFDSNGFDSTLSGIISGTGSWTKTGNGTLYQTGGNTYTGGTFINGGTLAIRFDTNLGDPSGPLTFNGGVLRTLAPLTTWRAITVNGGGGTIDTAGNTLTLNGTFAGSGPYSQTGSGTVTMAGNGSGYTGSATLLAGRLTMAATGSLGGVLTVNAPAVLSGWGTLNTVTNHGLVSPGGSIGTLNLTGDYTQGPTAVFVNEIDPSGRGDQLTVAGSVTLNGGLLFVSAPIAYYRTGSFWQTIAAAGGQTGAFSGVVQDFPSSILRFASLNTPGGTVTVAARLPYATYAANSRAASAGQGLNKGAYAASGDFANAILAFDLANPAAIASSLNQLHPEPYDAFTQSGFDSGRLATASIQGRLSTLRTGHTQAAFASPFDIAPAQAMAVSELTQGAPLAARLDAENPVGIFLQPFGMTARQGGTGGRTAYGYTTWGMLGGMDLALSKNIVAGVFGGYASRTLALAAPASDAGRAETMSLGGYASYFGEKWFVESALRLGLDSYHAKRALSSPLGSSKVSAAWGGWNLFANVGAGCDWHAAGWVLGPIGAVEFARMAQSGYGESGGGSLGLTVRSRADASLQSSLGVKVARPMEYAWGALTPEVRMAWGHEWLGGSRDIAANFQGFENSGFTTKTVPPASDWAAVSAAVTVKCASSLSLTARVSTDLFRRDYQALAGSLGLRYSF